jgi:hypothetical protein
MPLIYRSSTPFSVTESDDKRPITHARKQRCPAPDAAGWRAEDIAAFV